MPGIIHSERQSSSGSVPISHEVIIDGFEQLRAATPSTTSEIIQMEAGRMSGRLKHATIAGLSLGLGAFSRGLLSRGVYSNERVTIGCIFEEYSNRSDFAGISIIRIWPPGVEHESRYYGGASFGAISVSVEDLTQFLGPDDPFGKSFSRTSNSFQSNPQTVTAAGRALRSIMSSFDNCTCEFSDAEAEFWKRSILEAATSGVRVSQTADVFIPSPERLVRKARAYIDGSRAAPVHISELVSALGVSRRTLHRAFEDVLGIPPITYLRHKRLCEARILLKESTKTDITVAEIAFKQGFSDFGRFSGYYRSLFGENPSETLRSRV